MDREASSVRASTRQRQEARRRRRIRRLGIAVTASILATIFWVLIRLARVGYSMG